MQMLVKLFKKRFERLVRIDIKLHKNTPKEALERYTVSTLLINYALFENNIGEYGGIEMVSKIDIGWESMHYFFVLENSIEKAITEINRITKLLKLKKYIKLNIGDPQETKINHKKKYQQKNEIIWIWERA